MQESDLSAIYGRIGEAGFERLTRLFYRRVIEDDVLRPLYPEEDLEGAEERLRLFLIFRFGGPPTYIETRGHPRLRMRHAPFAIDGEARDHWVNAMNTALDESQLDDESVATLREFFAATATFLINRA